jgi:hypothetical protein
MTEHGLALTLVLLIVAERNITSSEYATHEVIARLLTDWPDEQKADLYARIEESVLATDTIGMMRSKISAALWQNESWNRG